MSMDNKYIHLTIWLFIAFCGSNVMADNVFSDTAVSIDIGDIEPQLAFYENVKYFELRYGIGSIFIENKSTGIGIEYDILKGSIYYYRDPNNNADKIYFFNPTLYWNIPGKKLFILGPFFSVNYFFYNNLLAKGIGEKEGYWDLSEYILDTGIKFVWKGRESRNIPFTFGIKAGYRISSHGNDLIVSFQIIGGNIIIKD
jgi:hypothetical protein